MTTAALLHEVILSPEREKDALVSQLPYRIKVRNVDTIIALFALLAAQGTAICHSITTKVAISNDHRLQNKGRVVAESVSQGS